MLVDGRYSAWFRIPLREGMGVITLANGRINGSDMAIAYSGSYEQQGDAFTATISTRRHSEGHVAFFGIDEVDIDIVGTSKITTACGTGRSKQRPEVPMEIVLIRMTD